VETGALTERLTAGLGSNGASSGFGGRNHTSGTYRTSGAEGLSLAGPASTQMAALRRSTHSRAGARVPSAVCARTSSRVTP